MNDLIKDVAMLFAQLVKDEPMNLGIEIDSDFSEHLWYESKWKEFKMDEYIEQNKL
jgi:hypothetical protein